MAAHPHVGDVDHRIRISVVDDDGAVVALTGPVTFRFRKPDGSTADVTATLVSSGTTGVAYYDTLADTLDQAGSWSVQAKDGSAPFFASVESFTVSPNL